MDTGHTRNAEWGQGRALDAAHSDPALALGATLTLGVSALALALALARALELSLALAPALALALTPGNLKRRAHVVHLLHHFGSVPEDLQQGVAHLHGGGGSPAGRCPPTWGG